MKYYIEGLLLKNNLDLFISIMYSVIYLKDSRITYIPYIPFKQQNTAKHVVDPVYL